MLILTRFAGQSFQINLEDESVITIRVLDNHQTEFGIVSKIGIDAPRNLNIVRTELIRRPKTEKDDDS